MKTRKPTDRQLREARDLFHDLLSVKTKENEWQQFFSNNPYVLSMSLPVPLRLEPEDIVPMGRPGRTEPDFVFYPHKTTAYPCYGVIEIKKPESRIVAVTRRNATLLSRDAETAIVQSLDYASRPDVFFKSDILTFAVLGAHFDSEKGRGSL